MSIARKQELCLDAIEHSFLMARLAYTRVVQSCRVSGASSRDPEADAMMLDAWSLVDVIKRLRSVLEHTPGLTSVHTLRRFLQSTEHVPYFRHYIQHLEEKTAEVAPTGHPIWGSVSWVQLGPDKLFKVLVNVPGRLAKAKGIPMVNPAGREFHDDIDHFEMTVGGKTINLSEVARQVEVFEANFNGALAHAKPRAHKSGDSILIIDLDPAPVE